MTEKRSVPNSEGTTLEDRKGIEEKISICKVYGMQTAHGDTQPWKGIACVSSSENQVYSEWQVWLSFDSTSALDILSLHGEILSKLQDRWHLSLIHSSHVNIPQQSSCHMVASQLCSILSRPTAAYRAHYKIDQVCISQNYMDFKGRKTRY